MHEVGNEVQERIENHQTRLEADHSKRKVKPSGHVGDRGGLDLVRANDVFERREDEVLAWVM